MKIIYGLLIVLGSFFGTLWFMDWRDTVCPSGNVTVLKRPFILQNQLAYYSDAPALGDIADRAGDTKRSPVILCEGDRRLGPAHSAHTEVASKGGGRFSHWNAGIIFSTSDNTNPNENGRSYSTVRP